MRYHHRLGVTLAGFVFWTAVPAHADEKGGFRFEIRGYAQLDYVQAFQGVDPNWQAALRASRIATDEEVFGTEPNATLSVRQSRFGAYADFPTGGAGHEPIHTSFEFDLFGVNKDEGQTTMRVRKVYGEWKWLLAGQTNSVFMDGDIFPNVIEYWGPTGMVLYRNPQVRLSPIRGVNELAFAIERPGTDIDPGLMPGTFESRQPVPDFTAHYRYSGRAGHVQMAALLRDLAYRSTNPDGQGDALGWGAHFSSVATIGRDVPSATLRLSAVYGHGIANYMNDGGSDLVPRADGTFVGEPLLGLVGFIDLQMTELFGASLGYSFTAVDNQGGQSAGAFQRGDYASANVLLTPHPNVLAGLSYTWGRRTDADGETGLDQRVQMSFKYSFSSAPPVR